MGPKAVTFSEEDRAIVSKLNALLDQLHVSNQINTIADIGAGVFVTLFEGLCGEQLPGIIRSSNTREDEIHNLQIVIDSLAGEVLHTSLTHISGADIIDGSREAINNLTEIFSGLLEYMLNKIDSDVSLDNDDDTQNLTTEDPDLITREQIDEILDAELRRERLIHEATGIKNGGPTARWVEESSPPSPKKDDALDLTVEDLTLSPTKGTVDTTAELIRESEEIERRLLEERRILEATKLQKERLLNGRHSTDARATGETIQAPKSPVTVLQQNGRKSPVSTTQATGTADGLAKDRESRADIIRRLENDPRYKYMLPPAASQTQQNDEDDDETFKHLQHMVEETAAMARAAVDCSPSRAKSMLETLETVNSQRRAVAAAKSPSRTDPFSRQPRSRGENTDLRARAKRASPSARHVSPKPSDRLSDNELSPSRAKRKVSFLVERSLTDSSLSPAQPSPVRSKGNSRAGQRSAGGSYLSFDDGFSDKENTSYEDRLRKQYHNILADLSDEGSPERYKTAASYRKNKHVELSNRPRALYTLGDTKKMVQQESEGGKKKIGFLQKIYREDLDELLDEADYLMNKNRKSAKDMEKQYQKKMMSGVKSKSVEEKTGPSVLKKTTKKIQPKAVSSKVKKTSSSGSIMKPQKKTLTIKDDEILTMLLEEFPHLHLSLHTWHELWRKGISQIEQITRAHQEVRRKKSHAQNQLEEAEKRQEILVNIMKKELEHGQRLKEVKERQASAITSRNKIHERRMQSARSRHYYDEYQVRMRSKMLKRRTREEMVFKKLFKDGLEIQKDRIKELRKYATEQRESQAKAQRNEIDSMENYYRDQFQMLAENIAKEKKELEVREKAQQKALGTMKKDLRKKMEHEIKYLQEQLVRDDDDTYFRQLDADRVIHDLKMAKYQVRV